MATIPFLPADLLPLVSTFLFVFAVVFGVLSYAKVFDDRRVNGALALAIALFSMAYEPLVLALTQYMPIAVGVLIVLFFLALLKKMFTKGEGGGDKLPILVTIILLAMLLGAFSQELTRFVPLGFDPTAVLWIGGLILVFLFFWFIYSHKAS